MAHQLSCLFRGSILLRMHLSHSRNAGYDQHHSESRAVISNGSYLQKEQLLCLDAHGIWQGPLLSRFEFCRDFRAEEANSGTSVSHGFAKVAVRTE